MGAPLGNQNGKRAAHIRLAVKRALARRTQPGDEVNALVRIHEKVVGLALEGEAWAVQYIADRLDGRAAQTVDVNQTLNVTVSDESALAGRLAAQLSKRAATSDPVH